MTPTARKKREQISPGKPGERFLTALRMDHADCSRVLSLLSRQSNPLLERPREALPLIREAFQFITVYLDGYHHPREDVLYEHLARRSKRNARALHALREEHARGTLLSERLTADLVSLSRPLRLSRLITLQEEIDEFVDRQRAHIAAEEHIMYSSTLSLLTAKEWHAIEEAAPPYDTRSNLSHRGSRAYPLLARHFTSTAAHRMTTRSGAIQRLGLHIASEAYGHFVGHALEGGWMALRQNREALRLVAQSMQVLCTPQALPAYAKAVRTAYRTDMNTIHRWKDEWLAHLRAAQFDVRSMWR